MTATLNLGLGLGQKVMARIVGLNRLADLKSYIESLDNLVRLDDFTTANLANYNFSGGTIFSSLTHSIGDTNSPTNAVLVNGAPEYDAAAFGGLGGLVTQGANDGILLPFNNTGSFSKTVGIIYYSNGGGGHTVNWSTDQAGGAIDNNARTISRNDSTIDYFIEFGVGAMEMPNWESMGVNIMVLRYNSSGDLDAAINSATINQSSFTAQNSYRTSTRDLAIFGDATHGVTTGDAVAMVFQTEDALTDQEIADFYNRAAFFLNKSLAVGLVGQSLAQDLDTAFGASGSAQMKTTLGQYFQSTAVIEAATDGSHLTKTSATGTSSPNNFWWDDGLSAQGQRYTDNIVNIDHSNTEWLVWLQGTSEAGRIPGTLSGAVYETALGELMDEFVADSTNLPNLKGILICPWHRSSNSALNAGGQAVREAQLNVIEAKANIHRGPELYDLNLDDGTHLDASGNTELGRRIAERIAFLDDDRLEAGTLGPILSSGSFYGTTLTAQVTHDEGTDITVGTDAEDMFYVEDGSGTISVSEAARVDADSVSLTLASIPGRDVKLYSAYGSMSSLPNSNPGLVRDNRSSSMPLRTGEIDIDYGGGKGTRFGSGFNYYFDSSGSLADNNKFTFFQSMTFAAGAGSNNGIAQLGNGVQIYRNTAKQIQVKATSSSGTIVEFRSTVTVEDNDLANILITIDSSGGSPVQKLYINGTEVSTILGFNFGAATIDFSGSSGVEYLNFSSTAGSTANCTIYQRVVEFGTIHDTASDFSDGETLLNLYEAGGFTALGFSPDRYNEAKAEGSSLDFRSVSPSSSWLRIGTTTQNENWPQ